MKPQGYEKNNIVGEIIKKAKKNAAQNINALEATNTSLSWKCDKMASG